MVSWQSWSFMVLKGIVHPKMKNLPSFTNAQAVPNLNEFLSSFEHKKNILVIDCSIYEKKKGIQWLPSTVWLSSR